jgi:hypothetical protein
VVARDRTHPSTVEQIGRHGVGAAQVGELTAHETERLGEIRAGSDDASDGEQAGALPQTFAQSDTAGHQFLALPRGVSLPPRPIQGIARLGDERRQRGALFHGQAHRARRVQREHAEDAVIEQDRGPDKARDTVTAPPVLADEPGIREHVVDGQHRALCRHPAHATLPERERGKRKASRRDSTHRPHPETARVLVSDPDCGDGARHERGSTARDVGEHGHDGRREDHAEPGADRRGRIGERGAIGPGIDGAGHCWYVW